MTHKGVCKFTVFYKLITLAAMRVTYLLACDTNLSTMDKKSCYLRVLPPPLSGHRFQTEGFQMQNNSYNTPRQQKLVEKGGGGWTKSHYSAGQPGREMCHLYLQLITWGDLERTHGVEQSFWTRNPRDPECIFSSRLSLQHNLCFCSFSSSI